MYHKIMKITQINCKMLKPRKVKYNKVKYNNGVAKQL